MRDGKPLDVDVTLTQLRRGHRQRDAGSGHAARRRAGTSNALGLVGEAARSRTTAASSGLKPDEGVGIARVDGLAARAGRPAAGRRGAVGRPHAGRQPGRAGSRAGATSRPGETVMLLVRRGNATAVRRGDATGRCATAEHAGAMAAPRASAPGRVDMAAATVAAGCAAGPCDNAVIDPGLPWRDRAVACSQVDAARLRTQNATVDAMQHPQFLDHRPRRPRQVHAGRSHHPALRRPAGPRDGSAGARLQSDRARARHHHQGAVGLAAVHRARRRRPTS